MRRTVLTMTAVILSACGGEPDAPETGPGDAAPSDAAAPTSPPAPEPVQATRMYVFDCGEIEVSDLDIFSTEGDYAGVSDVFADACFLIRHPEGDLLWDLGLPSALAGEDAQQSPPFTVSLDQTLTEQLAEIGLGPEDIDFISISHAHFDHSGQADQFPDAEWLVYEAEYDSIFSEDGETEPDYAAFTDLNRTTIDGAHDVFGDGAVVIRPAPGHTPGHAYLEVNLPETGPVLLTGDLYHRAESRALKRVPRFNWDVTEPPAGREPGALSRESMDEFEARAERIGARVIIQHEPADIDPLPKPPEAMR